MQPVLDVDSTAIEYNFIGNDRKPLYVCTWLASKSVPLGTSNGEGNSVGGAAGYLFFQTRDGFHFRSIDTLFEGELPRSFFILTPLMTLVVVMMQRLCPTTLTGT